MFLAENQRFEGPERDPCSVEQTDARLRFDFVRNESTAQPTIQGQSEWQRLSLEDTANLYLMLTNASSELEVTIPAFYPLYGRLQAVGEWQALGDRRVSTTLKHTLNVTYWDVAGVSVAQVYEWWSLKSNRTGADDVAGTPAALNYNGPCFVVVSDRTASAALNTLLSMGMVGLYVTVILAIGRAVRAYIGSFVVDSLHKDPDTVDELYDVSWTCTHANTRTATPFLSN